MEQLKKCPFCGSEVRFATEDGNWILCPKCGAESAYFNSKEKAIAAWNTRNPMKWVVEKLEKASYMTECTFDEDGWSNNDNYEVVLLDDAIEIVKEEM